MKNLSIIALVLAVIGAVNWGLYGLVRVDLVKVVLGDMTLLARIVYVLVGLAGLFTLTLLGDLTKK